MQEPLFCPACGKPTTYKVSPEWLLGHFSGRYANILAALIQGRHLRRGLSIDELVEAAYIDRAGPLDMPVDPTNGIRALIVETEPRLNKLRWSIAGPKTTGCGFWLVPIEVD